MYYNVCMKISKTFRLSQEAVDILNEQPNATEFLEALILDNYTRPLEVVPLQQLKDLLQSMGPPRPSSIEFFDGTPPENKKPTLSSPTARTAGVVYGEIQSLTEERDSMFSQDPDDYTEINKQIQELWNEYNALKEQQTN